MKSDHNKRIYLILSIVGAFLLLVFLLASAEANAEGTTIRNVGDAFWYALTTLTTVGYGDTYPVTHAGRALGVILQLLSVGVFFLLIGSIFNFLRSRFFPVSRLCFKRGRDWFIFSKKNEISRTLAKGIRSEFPKSVILFADSDPEPYERERNTIYADVPAEELMARKKRKGAAHLFYVSRSFVENERSAEAITDPNVTVYYLSDHEPHELPDNKRIFNPYDCCARLYWQQYPVFDPGEKILISGTGKYAQALLEQALIQNVFDPAQHVSYRMFGSYDDFLRNHPYLDRTVSIDHVDTQRDSVLFSADAWNSDPDLLRCADRIIFCDDDETVNNAALSDLRRYFPTKAAVYARTLYAIEDAILFGAGQGIYFPELIMRMKLNRTAIRLHEIYQEGSPGQLPSWEKLGYFLRRSNLASADHLEVKMRILLGADSYLEMTSENCRKAYEIYRSSSEEEKDRFRRIEHERWMRFHILLNWQYAAVRNNDMRLHPLLLPYDQLSDEDKRKDEYAWELFRELI